MWSRHDAKDHPFQPRQTFCLNDTTAHIQDQVWEWYLDRADSFTRITTDTQALWPSISLQAVVKRSHNQPDSTTINVAECVPSNLLVRRADVRTGRATNA